MQTFELGTQVLVARPFGINCTDLDVVTNLSEDLVPKDCNVGWKDLTSLTSYDKVLLYNHNEKAFLFMEIPKPEVFTTDKEFIILGGQTSVGGTGFSSTIQAGKVCSYDTPCFFHYIDDSTIYLCNASELYDIAKRNFFRPRGIDYRGVIIKAIGVDVEYCNSSLNIQNIELNYNLCKNLGSNTRLAVNVDLGYNFILLTKYDERNMF